MSKFDPVKFEPGTQVEYMVQGRWEGPFTVTAAEGRTPDHIVLQGQHGLFEHYVDSYDGRALNTRKFEPKTYTGATLKLASGVTYELDANNDTVDVPDEDSVRLVGFQNGHTQRVVLFAHEWEQDPGRAVGLCPVFSRGEDGIFAMLNPVIAVDHA